MKNNKKILLWFFIALNLIFLIVFIIPKILQIKKSAQLVLETKNTINTQAQKKQNSSGGNISQQKEDLDKIMNIFVIKDKELEFIKNLETIAQKYSYDQKIDFPDVSVADKEKQINELPLSVSLNGSIGNLLPYLLKLESLSYYFNINDIAISTNASNIAGIPTTGQENNNTLIQASLKGKIYFLTAYDQL